MGNIIVKRKIKYKYLRKHPVVLTIFVVVLFVLFFGSVGLADSMQDEILDALEQGLQAAGYPMMPYDNTEGFDTNTPEGLDIYNVIAFGYVEEDDYRAATEIYFASGKNGDVSFVVSVYCFDTEEYAKEALQSNITQTKRLLEDMTSSSSNDNPQTEEEALEALADQMFSTSRCDFTLGTFHGNASYFAHGYAEYSSSEADQMQKQMFGDIHSYTYAWTQSNLMVTVMTLKSGLVNAFAPHIYTALQGVEGQLSQTTEPTATPELQLNLVVSADPQVFQQLLDEVQVTARLTDGTGAVITDETVICTDRDDGTIQQMTTDGNGQAVFVLRHDREDAKRYRYQIESMGLSRMVDIPVLGAKVTIEINPDTGQPYVGIIAEDTNGLELSLDFYDMPDGTLTVDAPQLGTIEGSSMDKAGSIKLVDGKATVIYVPPAYLAEDQLTDWDSDLSSWKTEDLFVFSYTTWDDKVIEYQITIDLYRPPIMLVHGFTGDATTWQKLDGWLQDRKYTTICKEYYAGNQSVQAQALELHRNVRLELARYSTQDIKDGKVDVVAHSMGGLITRYYTNHTAYYTGQVRKLIMVGTPNHGCSWNDLQLGKIQAWLIDKHKIAAAQLYQDSALIKQLNYGESVGAHLNPDIQYGLFYSYSFNPIFFGGDMVVSAPSARLNGVQSFSVRGGTHSGVFSDVGMPITDDVVIFAKIQSWLITDIYRAALRNTKIELVRAEGEVTVRTWIKGEQMNVLIDPDPNTTSPMLLKPWDDIITYQGKAMIRILIDGVPWGYVHLDQDTKLRIGHASPRLMEVKMFGGSARYTTFEAGGGHFTVELQPNGDSWQSVTALDTDFVIDMQEDTVVTMLKGNAIVAAQNDKDVIEQLTIDKIMPVQISADGEIINLSKVDIPDTWWKDEFYKIPKTTIVLAVIVNLKDKMIAKSQRMGYSIYVILAVILILALMMLKSRRCKWLFWLLLVSTSAICIYMLYYSATDIQMPILSQIDNLLSSLKDSILMAGGGVILAMIVLSGLFSLITGKRRGQKHFRGGNDGFDYYYYDNDDYDGDD